MEAKRILTSVGLSALLLGVGMNTHFAINDHGIKEASLSQFVEGQSSGTVFSCTLRGGEENPDKVLMMRRCVLNPDELNYPPNYIESLLKDEMSLPYLPDGIKFGDNCKCVTIPSRYSGIVGCNAIWETECK